eukprot:GHRR01027414.1.p1 GENE.GHRR01027414.1~~GHRR01027414.1.p1  ORF type:complete len:104 (+),score=20.14 GHRR01027414.1:668-979(+)
MPASGFSAGMRLPRMMPSILCKSKQAPTPSGGAASSGSRCKRVPQSLQLCRTTKADQVLNCLPSLAGKFVGYNQLRLPNGALQVSMWLKLWKFHKTHWTPIAF